MEPALWVSNQAVNGPTKISICRSGYNTNMSEDLPNSSP